MAKAKKKAETKAPEADEKVKEVVIYSVNAKALSVDVGPKVLAGLAKSMELESEANKMLGAVKTGRYDAMTMTTEAIVKAAKADKSIDLTLAFSAEKKNVEKLNIQLGLALGFREYHDTGKGAKRLIYAKSVQGYFPAPTDTKGSEEAVKKATLRSNFSHMLKKCTQAACAITEQGITIKNDTKAGTLRISGPRVEEVFGAKSVLLNERQKFTDGDKKVELKDRPSFTALASLAAADHGAVVIRKSGSRGAGIVADPIVAMKSLCASLVAGIAKIEKPMPQAIREALESVESAITVALD